MILYVSALSSLQLRHPHHGTPYVDNLFSNRRYSYRSNPRNSVSRYVDFTAFACLASVTFHFHNLLSILTRQRIPPQELALNWDRLAQYPLFVYPTHTIQFLLTRSCLLFPNHPRINLAYPAHRLRVLHAIRPKSKFESQITRKTLSHLNKH